MVSMVVRQEANLVQNSCCASLQHFSELVQIRRRPFGIEDLKFCAERYIDGLSARRRLPIAHVYLNALL